jgi:hypothetical protein
MDTGGQAETNVDSAGARKLGHLLAGRTEVGGPETPIPTVRPLAELHAKIDNTGPATERSEALPAIDDLIRRPLEENR